MASVVAVVLPLIAQVVDNVDGACLRVGPVGPVLIAHVEGNETGLPVVCQENALVAVRGAPQVQDQRCFHRGEREQREAEKVVRVLPAAVVVVQAAALLDGRVLHENAVAAPPILHLHPLVQELYHLLAPVHDHAGLAYKLQALVVLVLRRDHHGPVPAPRELVRIGSGHQTEPASLGPGRELAGHHYHRDIKVVGLVERLGLVVVGPCIMLLLGVRHEAQGREAVDVLQGQAALGGGLGLHTRRSLTILAIVGLHNHHLLRELRLLVASGGAVHKRRDEALGEVPLHGLPGCQGCRHGLDCSHLRCSSFLI
mmetsp:Transcript_14704/g.42140  ORF Transcript_14704/g.42140 Transcript_14704/m.42140 type:complete len:312 (-) Transcript_14704:460-1395(-)